jgi:hypothetical protein
MKKSEHAEIFKGIIYSPRLSPGKNLFQNEKDLRGSRTKNRRGGQACF